MTCKKNVSPCENFEVPRFKTRKIKRAKKGQCNAWQPRGSQQNGNGHRGGGEIFKRKKRELSKGRRQSMGAGRQVVSEMRGRVEGKMQMNWRKGKGSCSNELGGEGF